MTPMDADEEGKNIFFSSSAAIGVIGGFTLLIHQYFQSCVVRT